MKMNKFLKKEAVTGNLHGVLPPHNSTKIWGSQLWNYLSGVADITPEWFDKVLAFPTHQGDFSLEKDKSPEHAARLLRFRLQYDHNMIRDVVYYGNVIRLSYMYTKLPTCLLSSRLLYVEAS